MKYGEGLSVGLQRAHPLSPQAGVPAHLCLSVSLAVHPRRAADMLPSQSDETSLDRPALCQVEYICASIMA